MATVPEMLARVQLALAVLWRAAKGALPHSWAETRAAAIHAALLAVLTWVLAPEDFGPVVRGLFVAGCALLLSYLWLLGRQVLVLQGTPDAARWTVGVFVIAGVALGVAGARLHLTGAAEKSDGARMPNRYVCTYEVAPMFGSEVAERAVVVEFGVHGYPTQGFAFEVELSTPYFDKRLWMGEPLTATEQDPIVGYPLNESEQTPERNAYSANIVLLPVTRETSKYAYFEGPDGMEIEHILFWEDSQGIGDPARNLRHGKRYGACPI